MNETPYTLQNWYRPTEMAVRMRHMGYEDLLWETIESGEVLHYIEEDDYQGDWCAFVTDGERIGLVEGSFGSCGGCDALEDARDNDGNVAEVMEGYLRSVRTFSSWEDVATYLQESERENHWSFRRIRPELISFVDELLLLGGR